MCSVRHSPMPSAPKPARAARVLGRVGVGAHAERAQLVAPAEHGVEARVDVRRRRAARRRCVIAPVVPSIAIRSPSRRTRSPTRTSRAWRSIVQVGGAGDRGAAHPARDERGVRGLAALGGEDALGGVKARDVVGLGERAHEDDIAAVLGGRHRLRRREDDRALGRARRGGDAARDDLVARRRGRTSGAAARRASERRSS